MVGDDAEMARDGGNVGCRRGLLRLDLVAHRGNSIRIRPDKNDAGGGECLGKSLALGEKAVTGMDRFDRARFAGVHNLVHQQVALGRLRRANENRGVRHLDVQGVFVGLRIDGDRLNSHPTGGFDDSAGNFAAIGNQYTLEHAALRNMRRYDLGRPLTRVSCGYRRRLQYCLRDGVSSAATRQRSRDIYQVISLKSARTGRCCHRTERPALK